MLQQFPTPSCTTTQSPRGLLLTENQGLAVFRQPLIHGRAARRKCVGADKTLLILGGSADTIRAAAAALGTPEVEGLFSRVPPF